MKKVASILTLILGITFIGYFLVNRLFVIPEVNSGTQAIGIIDYHLTANFDDLVVKKGSFVEHNETSDVSNTHGDKMMSFIQTLGVSNPVYFYAADDEVGIQEDGLLEGLEWMDNNGIKNINISLSTKQYSAQIDSWIKEHPDTQIYVSYNNLLNTVADYPAMYKGVISSGSDKRIPYKECDQAYSTSRIVIIRDGFHMYNGNSFLSVITLLTRIGEE